MNDITNRKIEDNNGEDIETPKIDTAETEAWLHGERDRLIESAGLSDEEREGLELARRLEAGEDVDLDGDGGSIDDDDDAPPAPAAQTPAPQAAPEPVQPPAQSVPDPVVDLAPIKAQAAAELKALRERWTNGEATDEEFDTEQERIVEGRLAAERKAIEDARAAAIEQEMQRQNQARADSFLADARAYAEKNPILFSKEHINSYDTYVRAVTSDPGNAKMSNEQMLAMAHEMYANAAQARGVTIPLPAGRRAAPKPASKVEIPPSIARIPAAAPNTASDAGRLAQLQASLMAADGLESERIWAGMTEAERDAVSRRMF